MSAQRRRVHRALAPRPRFLLLSAIKHRSRRVNLVPRYLPPVWDGPGVDAGRPLVLVFAAVAFLVTWIFDADVDAPASPLAHFLRFILRGSGEVAPVTHEVLRRAEPDRSRRPHVHVG